MSEQFVTRTGLVGELRDLGVPDGGVAMVHTKMSALGWVVGGTRTVIESLLDVVGPDGTLIAYTGFEDDPYHLGEWSPQRQDAYRSELPAFDPELSAADPDFGRTPERLRTWPRATCSDAHVFRFVAVGTRAGELTADVPWDYAAGPGSPLARLNRSGRPSPFPGRAPRHPHLAPSCRDAGRHPPSQAGHLPGTDPGRRPGRVADGARHRHLVTQRVPVRDGHRSRRRRLRDHRTRSARRRCRPLGAVGTSESHVLDARSLVDFAVSWLRKRFS